MMHANRFNSAGNPKNLKNQSAGVGMKRLYNVNKPPLVTRAFGAHQNEANF